MTEISREHVNDVADAARLAINENEAAMFEAQLNAIMTYAERLHEVDTTDVEPTTHVLRTANVMRKDEAIKGLTQEEALENAPSKADGQFKVPSILE